MIAISRQNKPETEYKVSENATGNRHWKCSPAQHPVPIQDLLLYDIQNKHNQNKILGDKVAQVLQQNTQLAQQISSAYETPSEKLRKDPIMGFFTKTVATYMFLRHKNGQRQNNNPETQDFSSLGEPFFKRRSESGNESKKEVKRKITGLKTKNNENKRKLESESR